MPRKKSEKVVEEVVEKVVEEVVEPEKKPKKQSSWLIALKEWNKNKDKYTIPKKDTDDYNEVKKLMLK
jgi:hypothetical protein